MTSSSVTGFTQANADEDRVLPIPLQPPTARRQFSQSEQLEVHAEFYEPRLEGDEVFDQQINVITRVRSADGRTAWETTDRGRSEPLSGERFGFTHSTLVPIRDLSPGHYVVEVGAERLHGTPVFVSRSIPITIAPR